MTKPAAVLEEFRIKPFPDVRQELSFAPGLQRALLRQARKTLYTKELAEREDLRIASVKVLVASLPETLGDIEILLTDFSSESSYEVHFTLFCYLDEVLYFPKANALAPRVVCLVESYLSNVRESTAMAAWMAGDLLGDHWKSKEALEILIRVAMKARYKTGRAGSIHGLCHALDWASDEWRKEIVSALRRIARTDGSKSVRLDAQRVLRRVVETHRSS